MIGSEDARVYMACAKVIESDILEKLELLTEAGGKIHSGEAPAKTTNNDTLQSKSQGHIKPDDVSSSMQ